MNYKVNSVEEYIKALPEDGQIAIKKIREIIGENLPKGFEEQFLYDMITYVVPLAIYPKGYHASEGGPLPFISLASQKNHIALYHMGLYGDEETKTWFIEAYKRSVKNNLDMGKSCIRFKNMSQIPYALIGTLCQKMTISDYIKIYESSRPSKKK